MSVSNEDNIMHLPGQQLPVVQNRALQPHSYQTEEESRDEDDDEIDLRELWQVIVRRKGLIISIALFIFLAALIGTLMMKPVYRASTTLQIKPDNSASTDYLDVGGQSSAPGFISKDFYQTQYELLGSRMLATRTIEGLGIESDFKEEALAKPFFADALGEVRAWFDGSFVSEDAPGLNEYQDLVEPVEDERLILGERPLADGLLENLNIQPVKNSQVVTIHYDDTNPERASIIANALADNYIQINLERRADAAAYAGEKISEELLKTRSRLQEAEGVLNAYAKSKGIVLTENNESLVEGRLKASDTDLAEAVKDRIKAESEYNEISASGGASKALGNSAMQTMKQQLAELEGQYQARLLSSSSFEDSNIRALKQRLVQLQSEYQAEVTSSRAVESPVVRSMTQELSQLQSELKGEMSSSRAVDNPVIRSMKEQLARLQGQYQAEMSSSGSFENPAIQTMKQRLAQLRAQLQGGVGNNAENPTIQSLKQQVAQLEGQYQEKAQVYKPAYPLMVQLRKKINEAKQQIIRENQSVHKNLTQQINQLEQGIAVESRALSTNTRTNLSEQIKQLTSEIARETQTITQGSRKYLQQKINQLQASIKKETQLLGTGTRSYLKTQISRLQAEINRETKASDYNARASIKQQIEELKRQVYHESKFINKTVVDELRGRMMASREREKMIRAQLKDQEQQMVTLRDKNIGLNELKREVESIRNIYTGLLDRQKQVGIAGGLGNNNVAVVDEAVIPFKIHKPNVKLNIALGAVLGLFLGMVVAFLLEFMDDRINNTEELGKLTNLPLLGVIPKSKLKDSLKLAMMTQTDPRSAFAEAFRSLRTNLMFSTQHGSPRVLAVTSSVPSEGKSTSAVNIATTFAQSGSTVLLVDTDLRNPSVHKRLRLDNSKGLTNYLTNQDTIESVTQGCQIPGVYVVTAGPMTPNPVELLSSERLDALFALSRVQTFDVIVLDMPPVIGLADALVISSKADATMVAVAMGESKKQALVGSLKRLHSARANVIGFIATKTKQGSGYGYNYEYYGYGTDKKLLDAA